tara:strand:- start:820 stop:1470 length:651 start_codon:yes stop_codon:yes gene_type:complete
MLITVVFPWFIKKWVYRAFGYTISDTAHVGLSWLYPDNMILADGARVGSLTVCKNISLLKLDVNARIGALNWITGFPLIQNYQGYFSSELDRSPSLILGSESAITARHMIDCTACITIGSFSTIAGVRSQFLTHGIDISLSRQISASITVGDYCFIGTGCIFLKGCVIPNFSVVGAGSIVNSVQSEEFCLFAGVPAKKIKNIHSNAGYFLRLKGVV